MSGIDIDTGEHKAVTSREPEGDDVQRWRFDQLLRAGYSERSARELAAHPEVDLHRACDMLAEGCSEETAVAILT
jgi:hypothetical protein